jgi:uncharacterized protein YcfJ
MQLTGCAPTAQNLTAPERESTVGPVAPPARETGHVVNIKKDLPVRIDTSLQAKQLGKFLLNNKVYIDEEKGDWYRVTALTPAGSQPMQGWVLKKYIEKDPVPLAQAAVGSQPTGQPQEQTKDLTGMKTRTVLEGGAAGAVVGAGLGAIVAMSQGKDVAKGAMIGGVAGGATGLAAGYYVAGQKEKFATEEAYLDACVCEARKYNQEAKASNEYLRNYVAQMQVRVEQLKAQIKVDSTKKQLARDELTGLSEKKQSVDKMIDCLCNEVKAQEGAVADSKNSPKTQTLVQEVELTRLEIEKLKIHREELIDLNSKMYSVSI